MQPYLRNVLGRDLAAATAFLTVVPSMGDEAKSGQLPDFRRAARAFPLVGALVGAVGGIVLLLASALHLPPLAAALLAVVATIALTGALHEDGLADTFDGLAGGRTIERRLEIMRDSRIGTYGALALVLSVGLRVALLAAYLPASPWQGALALVATEAIGRTAIVWLWSNEPPARPDGLAATLGAPDQEAMGAALVIGAGIGMIAGSLTAGVFAALISLAAAALATVVTADWSRRRIGGRTGDILGAAEQLAALASLLALAAFR
ncbi:adenosylcobinamide-GDP ribazoletransferase [Kaistia algarum]|uniref:adenosylcobinamide-GDP ribazoletransferase n=1 Tax=Kaistia algarum TaxID=2083279 RepID=UPI000CE9077C|nr:adenosylcobinamide-GDP ribazoletransferase [Kaistia algarum]MCX5514659.1 adenosylcobinamide-GDP ribazoletransferase [Kaistia algarum]PPE78909.1 adenosylcobinamide-GDP ribazoletransferase [Kaistia algarum]